MGKGFEFPNIFSRPKRTSAESEPTSSERFTGTEAERGKESEAEFLLRRKTRFERHLDTLHRLLKELPEESDLFKWKKDEKDVFLRIFPKISKDDVRIGLSAAAQTLAGGGIAGFAMTFIRSFGGPALSSATAFLGGHVFSEGARKLWDYFYSSVSQEQLDELRRKKSKKALVGDDVRPSIQQSETAEKITERNLRNQMMVLQSDTSLEMELRALQASFEKAKKESPSAAQLGEALHLKRVGEYLDRIILQQKRLLQTMEDYYVLASVHEAERAQIKIGFGTATAVLESGLAIGEVLPRAEVAAVFREYFSGQTQGIAPRLIRAVGQETAATELAAAIGTFWALLTGLGLQGERGNLSARGHKNIENIFERFRGTLGKLEQERERVQKRHDALSEKSDEILRKARLADETARREMAQKFSEISWSDALGKAIGRQIVRAQREDRIPQPVAQTEETFSFDPLSPGISIEEFLGLVLPPSEAGQSEGGSEQEGFRTRITTTEHPMRAIKPMPKDAILRSKKQTVVGAVIADCLRIAGEDVDSSLKEKISEMPFHDVLQNALPAALERIAEHSKASEPELDEVVRYLGELDEIMSKSIADFVFPTSEDIASLKEVQRIIDKVDKGKKILPALEKMRHDAARVELGRSSQSLRAFLLRRYHVVDEIDEEKAVPLFFNNALQSWRKTAHRHDKFSLHSYLEIFEHELKAYRGADKQEKSAIIESAFRILNAESSEAPFIDLKKFDLQPGETLVDARRRELRKIIFPFQERCANSLFSVEAIRGNIVFGKWGKKARATVFETGREKVEDTESRYVSGKSFGDANYSEYPSPVNDHGLRVIDPRFIIGSIAPDRDCWITELDKPQVIDFINALTEKPEQGKSTEQVFDEFYFDQETGAERVELIKFVGPQMASAGRTAPEQAFYFVRIGVRFVSAAKALGLPIVARVRELRQPTALQPIFPSTMNGDRHNAWHMLTNKRLIASDIHQSLDIENGKPEIITIKHQILSWLPWFSLDAIVQICDYYDKLYPQALDNLKTLDKEPIMKNALCNPSSFRRLLRSSS